MVVTPSSRDENPKYTTLLKILAEASKYMTSIQELFYFILPSNAQHKAAVVKYSQIRWKQTASSVLRAIHQAVWLASIFWLTASFSFQVITLQGVTRSSRNSAAGKWRIMLFVLALAVNCFFCMGNWPALINGKWIGSYILLFKSSQATFYHTYKHIHRLLAGFFCLLALLSPAANASDPLLNSLVHCISVLMLHVD